MKSLSSQARAALLAGNIIIRWFWRGAFGSGAKGFWNDADDVLLDDVPYYGGGGMVSISSVPGVDDLSIPGLTVTLSSNKQQAFDGFFADVWHQKECALRLGLFNTETRNLVDEPDLAFSGYMDAAKRTGGAGNPAKLTIQCEDASMRAKRQFYTVRSDADQRARLSTDTFHQRLATASQKTVYWNQPTPTGAKPGG